VVPKAEAIGGPIGSSFGKVTVDAAGKVKFAGTMADGTKVTQSAAVSQNGLWPLFISPYGGKGLVISWQQFADEEATDISGPAVWIRPPGGKGFYSGGFTNEATTTGSKLSPVTNAQQRNPGESDVAFSGGGVGSFTNIVTWNAGRATVVQGGKMTLTIASASGLFKGTASDPDSGKTLKFQGAVLTKGNVGAGFFLNNTESGEVHLNPLP
jgi:hypothetical protein